MAACPDLLVGQRYDFLWPWLHERLQVLLDLHLAANGRKCLSKARLSGMRFGYGQPT